MPGCASFRAASRVALPRRPPLAHRAPLLQPPNCVRYPQRRGLRLGQQEVNGQRVASERESKDLRQGLTASSGSTPTWLGHTTRNDAVRRMARLGHREIG